MTHLNYVPVCVLRMATRFAGIKKALSKERTRHAVAMVSLIFQSLLGLSDLAPTANAVALDLVAGLHGADPSAHLDKSRSIFNYFVIHL